MRHRFNIIDLYLGPVRCFVYIYEPSHVSQHTEVLPPVHHWKSSDDAYMYLPLGMFSVNRLTGFPINRTETDKMAAKMVAGSFLFLLHYYTVTCRV